MLSALLSLLFSSTVPLLRSIPRRLLHCAAVYQQLSPPPQLHPVLSKKGSQTPGLPQFSVRRSAMIPVCPSLDQVQPVLCSLTDDPHHLWDRSLCCLTDDPHRLWDRSLCCLTDDPHHLWDHSLCCLTDDPHHLWDRILLLTTCSVNGARLGSLDLKQQTADSIQGSYIWL